MSAVIQTDLGLYEGMRDSVIVHRWGVIVVIVMLRMVMMTDGGIFVVVPTMDVY